MKKNLKPSLGLLLFAALLIFSLNSCEETKINPPILSTSPATEITYSSVVAGGNITDDGGDEVVARGVCWATTANPDITGSHTTDGDGTGIFTSSLEGLTPGMEYHVRAYATNSAGTSYGNGVTFSTTVSTTATVTTKAISGQTFNSAISGGTITADGGDPITARGVCWSISTEPMITGSHTSDGSGTGSFDSNLSGLLPGTTYYARAYATNSKGTAYGNEVSFVTSVTFATVTTRTVTDPDVYTALGGGTITSDGGDPATVRGVCWSTAPEPTVIDSHTTNGTGVGAFESNITLLVPATTYYVRAYATNSKGTVYGEAVSFTTLLGDYDLNSYRFVKIGEQVWMAENLATTKLNDGTPIANLSVAADWEAGSAPAYVWYSNNEALHKPTYGALYNWHAVASNKLCPEGWHVPTEADWNILITYMGGVDAAGGKLKQAGTTLWLSPNEGATNESNFTALPGGGRKPAGEFEGRGSLGVWWTSTPSGLNNGIGLTMSSENTTVNMGNSVTGAGRSVRCLKN